VPCSLLFLHFRQLQSVRWSLTTDSAKTLVHALIASHLDYCNSVLYQINISATKTLQLVLHSAAWLIIRKWKFKHITPTLWDNLRWLLVPEKIVFKLCTIISSVSINPDRSTSRSCAFHLQLVPVATTCTLPLVGTYECLPVIRSALDHTAVLPVLQNCAIICHHHFAIQHWHLHSSVANDTSLWFGPWTCTHDCSGCNSGIYKFSHAYIQ